MQAPHLPFSDRWLLFIFLSFFLSFLSPLRVHQGFIAASGDPMYAGLTLHFPVVTMTHPAHCRPLSFQFACALLGMLMAVCGMSPLMAATHTVTEVTEATAWRSHHTFLRPIGARFYLHRFSDAETRMTCYALVSKNAYHDYMPDVSCVRTQASRRPSTAWRAEPTFLRWLGGSRRYQVHRWMDRETDVVCHAVIAVGNYHNPMGSLSCEAF